MGSFLAEIEEGDDKDRWLKAYTCKIAGLCQKEEKGALKEFYNTDVCLMSRI